MDHIQKLRSFYSAVKGVVSPMVSLVPYVVMHDQPFDLKYIKGMGVTGDGTEISVNDIVLASLFYDDVNLLLEGITGVGKNVVIDGLGQTLFSDRYVPIQSGRNSHGQSPYKPFLKTDMKTGYPEIYVDDKKCEVPLVIVDEINRYLGQAILSIADGKIKMNGSTHMIGLEAPYGFRKATVIAAMNPNLDEYTEVLRLDGAKSNRFIRLRVPNIAKNAGSSLDDKMITGDEHQRFWDRYRQLTGQSGSWQELYLDLSNPSYVRFPKSGIIREYMDLVLGIMNKDPLDETFYENIALVDSVYNSKINLALDKNNTYMDILARLASLKEDLTPRDIKPISNLARMISLIRIMKGGSTELGMSLEDVAASASIIYSGKLDFETGPEKMIGLVAETLKKYRDLRAEVKGLPDDEGMRNLTLQTALDAGMTQNYDALLKEIQKGITLYKALPVSRDEVLSLMMISRVISDLAVAYDFFVDNRSEIEAVMKKGWDSFIGDENTPGALEGILADHRWDKFAYDLRLSWIQ